MEGMITHLKTKGLGAHILDGPTGPIGKIKAGVIKMAWESNAILVPMYTSAEHAWFFNSWDRFMLPKPFSKITLTFGDEMHLSPDGSSIDFEAQRQLLEDTMLPGLILKKS